MEEFESFALQFGACGVYLLLREGRVVYAGQSLNVFARIGVHYQNMRRKQKGLKDYGKSWTPIYVIFDEVRFKACAKADLDAQELALIQKYMPQYNTKLKRTRPKIDITSLPGYAHLLSTRQAEPVFKRRKLNPENIRPVARTYRVTLPRLKTLEHNAT